jgi:hypothetical protein
MHKRYLLALFAILVIKAILLILMIFHSGIGLGPDEAQYWTWSQSLDWGYYSKPPGIAWEIALGTKLFGNTEFGVRALPLLIGFTLPWIIYWMAYRCNLKPKACFWAAVCMALSPMGILASFLAITDGGMIIFWSIACAYLAGKIEKQQTPNYLLIGCFILLGALFKWPIYLLWIVILVSLMFFTFLQSWHIVLGIGVSLLALLPSIYWNATHEWATFRHVLATLAGGHAKPKEGAILSGNLLEFLGAQAVLVSPILFVFLVIAWKKLSSKKKEIPKGVFFCGGISFVIIVIGAMLAFFMKMQGNWLIFAYPTAFILLGWYFLDGTSWKKKWLLGGLVFSMIACVIVFSIPKIQSQTVAGAFFIPYKINPFKHNVGWESLDVALKSAGYNEKQNFLFADKYQTVSILSFYGPEQKRAYFFNLQGARKNQFSYWKGMEQNEIGKKGFFVVVENAPHLDNPQLSEKYLKLLEPYFSAVRFIGSCPLFKVEGRIIKEAFIFEAEDYNGKTPQESQLY